MLRRFIRYSFVLAGVVGLAVQGHAQANRTWVSGVGDDANPCSRTAPCATFAGAIAKTTAGGQIDALDPGGFGEVTITKSITIDGGGNLASVLVAGTNGITVSAGASSVVILRNLNFDGTGGTGLSGIALTSGGQLVIENVTIQGFSVAGIDVNPGSGNTANVMVKNTSITSGVSGATSAIGVKVEGSPTRANVLLDQVHIQSNARGVDNSAANGFVDINGSAISQNSVYGIIAEGSGAINVENSMLTGNGVAFQMNAGTVRSVNNAVYDNENGFVCSGGSWLTTGNNRKGNNVGGGFTPCNPGGSVTLE